MNTESNTFSWKGFAGLIIILVIVSIIAYILASLEGFLAGVVVIFIGFLLSFFRDDLKRSLGLGKKGKAPITAVIVEDDQIEKLEKKITKGRQNIAKLISEYEAKPKKHQKIGLEIVEETTALLSLIDQAKSRALQLNVTQLVQHYEEIALEVEGIREKYQTYITK